MDANIRVSLVFRAEGGGGFERPLTDAETIAVFRLLTAPLAEPRDYAELKRGSTPWYIARALTALGDSPVRTSDILRQMVVLGWRSKSTRPLNVVGATLRLNPAFQGDDNGWWTLAAAALAGSGADTGGDGDGER